MSLSVRNIKEVLRIINNLTEMVHLLFVMSHLILKIADLENILC